MKTKKMLIAVIASLSFPLSSFAVSAPIVDTVPNTIDANSYTLTIFTENGATVTVVGGPGQIAPVTDGAGSDVEDGEVEVTVGLGQNTNNVFSIVAEKNGQTSNSVTVEILEKAETSNSGGDVTAPAKPILSDIPDLVDTAQYIISGTAEADANIYAYTVEGVVAGSTHTDGNGSFQITVDLQKNKTNRFNVTAEDEAGNEGLATQAVIRQSVDLPEPELAEDEEELVTSAQLFFGDTSGHWAELYINDLYNEGFVSGKSEGIFEPNASITRAELTKIAINAFGHSVNGDVDEHPFSDVPRNAWFAPYVEEAKRLEIVSGYPSGGFGPNDFVTRAAALKIILISAGLDAADAEALFSDVATEDWYAGYVTFASKNDIVNGYEDGTFGPGRSITRAEVAKIVVKVIELLSETE